MSDLRGFLLDRIAEDETAPLRQLDSVVECARYANNTLAPESTRAWFHDILRRRALRYADHPDYDPAWSASP